MPGSKRQRLTIFQSSLTYRDDRLAGLDAAVLMEVIEHLDPERIPALERVAFGFAAPATVVVTTPNAEYNVHFPTMEPGALRHRDHRFEWTRAEFRAWAGRVADSYQYQVRFLPVGPEHPDTGPAHPAGRLPPGRNAVTDSAMTDSAMTDSAMTKPSPLELAVPELSLVVPELSLVVLVGVTGSGKSTFARAHFRPTEVISSDFCRGLVADDENDQAATPAAFELLHYIAGKRLAAGRLTVVDATNVQPEARRELVLLAREHDVLPVAIVLDLPEKLCAERNAQGRGLGAHVLRRQRGQLRRGLHHLAREGFRTVHVLRTPEQVAAAAITRTRLFSDLRHESGPFDVIGDVHGCRAELERLLTELGYALERDAVRGEAHGLACGTAGMPLADAAPSRFGLPGPGAIWTRTGRPFFAASRHSPSLAAALIEQVRAAAEEAGLFDELGTTWLLLDAELLPWNVKAGSLLRDQYPA